MAIRRTPKVFNSSYQPPRSAQPGQYRSLRPLIWLTIVVAAVILISRLPVFTIKEVLVQGIDDQSVTDKLTSVRGHSIFSPFINGTVEQVRAGNPHINNVDCRRGLPDTVRCTVTLRVPSLVWLHSGKTWLVDVDGFIYAEGSVPDLPVIEDRSPAVVATGETVASREVITQYRELRDGLVKDGFGLTGMFITESLYQVGAILTNNNQPEVNWAPKSPVTVLFVTTYSLESQRQALKEVLAQKKESITGRIDLRVPGYVYTK